MNESEKRLLDATAEVLKSVRDELTSRIDGLDGTSLTHGAQMESHRQNQAAILRYVSELTTERSTVLSGKPSETLKKAIRYE